MNKTFRNQLKKFVEKENLSLNISVQDRQIVVSGSKTLVDFLSDNPESVQGLYDKILNKERTEADSVFETFKPGVLPKLTANMYDKNSWTGAIPRQNLQTYMLCLGFGRSGNGKCYRNQNDKPDGWPDSIALEHPSYMKKEDIKTVIESLLTHRNIDPKTFYLENTTQPKVTKKRRRKNPQSAETVDDEDEAEEGQEVVDGDAGGHHQPAIAPNANAGGRDENAVNENNNANNIEVEANQNQQPYNPYQLTLDPSGRWYWDYTNRQWYPYDPPNAVYEQNNK